MKKINFLLKLVSIIIGIIVGIRQIISGTPIGDILISLSLILIVFIPNILRKNGVKITPTIEFIYLLFIFLAQTLGSVLDFYQTFYFYDKAMHFLSGILTSLIGIYILVKSGIYSKRNVLFNCIIIIFTALALASFWEMFEFICNIIFGGDAQNVVKTGVDDTMIDIIAAFLGSILLCTAYLYEEESKNNFLIKKYITEIK